ncbi:hypothetical protein [Aquimarina latercula]|uniref:hypothetical protein n=1 Tax=Aquimarina latercula TaxID=987 RepID=UPI00042850AD|nr:hypothetical protein [Aquimarina latercula]
MKYLRNLLFGSLLSVFVVGCSSKNSSNKYQDIVVSNKEYVSTGGVIKGGLICPNVVNDVIVNLDSLDPLPKAGEPKMTVQGVLDFINKNKIVTITELLNRLPDHYKNNFSLVEKTKGEGQSNLKYPRIVLFGSDGSFLANISTMADDPKYDLLDVAELNRKTGIWEFSQFDFTKNKPRLHSNPISCVRCHGKNPRPVWGSNMDWPGVFGDNEAAGPNGEALSLRHARRMNEIRLGKTYSDRFDFLSWSDQELTSGGVRLIANNAFGAELLISNMAMGTATARGVFLRMKDQNSEKYDRLREVFLIAGYEHMVSGILSDIDKNLLRSIHKKQNKYRNQIDAFFMMLGIDTKEAFSLGTLAEEEKPKTDWSLGAGDLYELVLLQILNDLINDDKEVMDIVSSVSNESGIFGCDNLGETIKDVIDFKMLHMFYLSGNARYKVNEVYYPQDVENIKEKVFIPLYEKLVPYLKNKAFKKDNNLEPRLKT